MSLDLSKNNIGSKAEKFSFIDVNQLPCTKNFVDELKKNIFVYKDNETDKIYIGVNKILKSTWLTERFKNNRVDKNLYKMLLNCVKAVIDIDYGMRFFGKFYADDAIFEKYALGSISDEQKEKIKKLGKVLSKELADLLNEYLADKLQPKKEEIPAGMTPADWEKTKMWLN